MPRQPSQQDAADSPTSASQPPVWATALERGFTSLQKAVDALVEAGERSSKLLLKVEELEVEGLVVPPGLVVTIEGYSPTGTLLKPTRNTKQGGAEGAWFHSLPNTKLALRNLIFDGSGYLIDQAVRFESSLGATGCTFQNIGYEPQGPSYQGTALAGYGKSHLAGEFIVEDCRFSNIGRIGIYSRMIPGLALGVVYRGKGDGASQLDYGMEFEKGANVGVRQCDISACTGFVGADKSSGLLISTSEGDGTSAIIENCNIHGNNTGIQIGVGFGSKDTSEVTVQGCRIADNKIGIDCFSDNENNQAEGNWWGTNAGPDKKMNRGQYPLPEDRYLKAELAVAEVTNGKVVDLWTSTTSQPPPSSTLDAASGYSVFVRFAPPALFKGDNPPLDPGDPPLVFASAQPGLGTLTPAQQPFLRKSNLLGGPGTPAFTLATQTSTEGGGLVRARFDQQVLELEFKLQQPTTT